MNLSLIDLIKKYRDDAKNIANSFQSYYADLEYTGFFGMEPYLSIEISKTIKSIKEDTRISEIIEKISESEDFSLIFEIYSLLISQYFSLLRIMQIYEKYKVDVNKITHSYSSTSSSSSSLTINKAKIIVKKFLEISELWNTYNAELKSISLLNAIIKHISKKLEKKVLEDIKEINELYISYLEKQQGYLVIDLYRFLLDNIIRNSENTPSEIKITKLVNKYLEKLKTEVLDTEKIKDIGSQNKKLNVVQNIIQMHNLTPTGISKPLSQIFRELNIKKDNIEPDFDKIAKILSDSDTKKFGFIIIKALMKNPLEYNIWNLIDKNVIYKNKLFQSPDAGLNKIVIDRFKTIIQLENHGGKDELLIFNKSFGEDVNQNFYYILETIDNLNYRFLTLWSDSKLIPAHWFNNIDNKEFSPSRRLELYNILLNTEIEKHIQMPLAEFTVLNREESIKDENYWKALREKIANQIVKDVVDLFDEQFIDNKDNKMSVSKITNVMINPLIFKRALMHITENIELDTIHDLHNNISPEIIKQFQTELTLSYFHDLSQIQHNLEKDTTNIFYQNYHKKIEPYLNNAPIFVKNKISEMYHAVLDEVLEKYINKHSSIYLSIQKKFYILSKTII